MGEIRSKRCEGVGITWPRFRGFSKNWHLRWVSVIFCSRLMSEPFGTTHSSSSMGRIPLGFFSIRSRHSWLSTNDICQLIRG